MRCNSFPFLFVSSEVYWRLCNVRSTDRVMTLQIPRCPSVYLVPIVFSQALLSACRGETQRRSNKEQSLFKKYYTLVPSSLSGFRLWMIAKETQREEQGAKKRDLKGKELRIWHFSPASLCLSSLFFFSFFFLPYARYGKSDRMAKQPGRLVLTGKEVWGGSGKVKLYSI